MNWSLVTIRQGPTTSLAVRREHGSLLAPTELKRWSSMLELLDDWDTARPTLQTLDIESAPTAVADEILTPISWPRKIVCAGVNYRKHIREMGGEVPGDSWVPFFFLKPPTTTLIGPTDPIVIRNTETSRYDWEAELAVVIGRGGRDIAVGDALAHVAGYLPLGPGITPDFLVPDPQDLRLRLWVNDELQQDESTADMICTVSELISAASRITTLEPGDVIPTGTPSGVGAGRGLFLRAGDVVRTSIDGLGEITNPVIEA